jgi:enterochelin esterase family protein
MKQPMSGGLSPVWLKRVNWLILVLALGSRTMAATVNVTPVAQGKLTVGNLAAREIAPLASHVYTVRLASGDYLVGELNAPGLSCSLTVFVPDGTRLREFRGSSEAKRPFSLIAEAAGLYRLEITSAEKTRSGKYELRLTEKLSLDERLKSARPDEYLSQTIEQLRKEFAAGRRDTREFWRRIAQSGTPLVEAIANNERYCLVTFLWRGNADTRHVLITGSFSAFTFNVIGAHSHLFLMKRVAGSDVWYCTVKLPVDARFDYSLSPNDPLTFDGPRAAQREATWQADSLNGHPWRFRAGVKLEDLSKFEYTSMVELPSAPLQPWIVKRENVPTGIVKKHRLKSALLGDEHDIWVYTPAGYQSAIEPNALLFLFDADPYLDLVPTPIILDNLIAASKIPPTVAVFISNPSRTRDKELLPNREYAEFLAKELIPWTRTHYRVTSDPQKTAVAGSSFGGLAAANAGLRHSDIFGRILVLSGSFWWGRDKSGPWDECLSTEPGRMAKEFIAQPKLPLVFYMCAGIFENDSLGCGGNIVEPSRQMRDVLRAKGYQVFYEEYSGGHDYLNWRGTLANGLIALLRGSQ